MATLEVLPAIDPVPWERQRDEGPKAFHAFCHYRDLGDTRSLDKAFRDHLQRCAVDRLPQKSGRTHAAMRAPRPWPEWSARWWWVDRVALWDADIERQASAAFVKSQVDARARHARLAQAAQSALSVPLKAQLELLADPEYLEKLKRRAKAGGAGAIELLSLVVRACAALPAAVGVERLSLGMTTESIGIDDHRDIEFATRITDDPESTELAIRLLDRVARAGENPAIRLGAPRQPGDVEDGDPSEPADDEAG